VRTRSRILRLSALPCLLVLAAGCEEPRHLPNAGGAANQAPAPAANPAPIQTREILGKRTQDVRNAETELQQGAQVATTKITAKDPITLPGNAYVTIIGKTSMLLIEQAVNLYKATNDRYPKDYDEFMTEIIKANNIALPQLPYYQEYGYDEKEHKLIVLEYPDRKEQLQKQEDAKLGR